MGTPSFLVLAVSRSKEFFTSSLGRALALCLLYSIKFGKCVRTLPCHVMLSSINTKIQNQTIATVVAPERQA